MEKNITKKNVLYITESLCCTPETNNIVNHLCFNKNILNKERRCVENKRLSKNEKLEKLFLKGKKRISAVAIKSLLFTVPLRTLTTGVHFTDGPSCCALKSTTEFALKPSFP